MKGRESVQARTIFRVGAVAGIAYTALTIGVQIYGSTVPPVGTKAKLSSDQNDAIFLGWIGRHLDFYNVFAASATTGYVLLAIVALSLFTLLRRPGRRMSLIATGIGLMGMAMSFVAALLQRLDYVDKAIKYSHSHTAAEMHAVVKSFESLASRDYGIGFAGGLGVAFWIGLVGAGLMPLLGRRSVAVWGSLGACVLGGLGLTFVVPIWTLGAGFGLWRMTGLPVEERQARTQHRPEAEERVWAPEPEPVRPRRPPRPAVIEAEASSSFLPAETQGRPARGTAEARHMPAPARGSKAARSRKRR